MWRWTACQLWRRDTHLCKPEPDCGTCDRRHFSKLLKESLFWISFSSEELTSSRVTSWRPTTESLKYILLTVTYFHATPVPLYVWLKNEKAVLITFLTFTSCSKSLYSIRLYTQYNIDFFFVKSFKDITGESLPLFELLEGLHRDPVISRWSDVEYFVASVSFPLHSLLNNTFVDVKIFIWFIPTVLIGFFKASPTVQVMWLPPCALIYTFADTLWHNIPVIE